jgi:predicted O-methyltransferase YrrM
MHHCIMIRSSYSPRSPLEINRRRLALTRAVCAPSLASQSVKTARLVPKLHPRDPLLEERLAVYAATGLNVVPLLKPGTNLRSIRRHGWDALVTDLFGDGAPVLQTRMDDDDALARDFCARLYAGVSRSPGRQWYSFPRGLRVERGAWAQRRLLGNQFVTRRTVAGSGSHVYEVPHHQIESRELAVLDLEPAWMWVRHDDALSGAVPRSAAHPLSELPARFRFNAGALRPLPFRVRLLNHLIATRRYRSYLEIGVGSGRTFRAVAAARKVGVDPRGRIGVKATSDQWFASNRERFDLVFIDGLHHARQVLRDVRNSLAALSPSGLIVLHDCLPAGRRQQQCPRPRGLKAWNGDVWKAVVELRKRPDIDVAVLNADHGLGVVAPRTNTDQLIDRRQPSFDDYLRDRAKLLRIVDYKALLAFLGPD